MYNGREKKNNSNRAKKQKLSDLKQKEDNQVIEKVKNSTFNRPVSSNEISVIYPVDNNGKSK